MAAKNTLPRHARAMLWSIFTRPTATSLSTAALPLRTSSPRRFARWSGPIFSFLTVWKNKNTARRAGCCPSSDTRRQRDVLCFWCEARLVAARLIADRDANRDRRAAIGGRHGHRERERRSPLIHVDSMFRKIELP